MHKNYSMIVLLLLIPIVSTRGMPTTITTSLSTELMVGDTWTYKRSNSSVTVTATVVDAFTDEFNQKIIKVVDNSSEVIGSRELFGWKNETFSFRIVKLENLTKYTSAWGNFPMSEEGIMTINITLLPNITLEMPLTKTPMTLWSFYNYRNQYSYDPYFDAMEGEVGNIQRLRYVLDYHNETGSSTAVKRINILYDKLVYPTNLFYYMWGDRTYLARSAIQTYHGIDLDVSFVIDGTSYHAYKHFYSHELIYNDTKYIQLYDVGVPVQINRWGLHGSGTSTEHSIGGYVTTVDMLVDIQLMERPIITTVTTVSTVTNVTTTVMRTTTETITKTIPFELVLIISCMLLLSSLLSLLSKKKKNR